MYGAILGKNRTISLKELELVQPEDLRVQGHIALFNTSFPQKLASLGGLIKRGEIKKLEELSEVPELCGVSERAVGKYLKGKGLTRRFKEVDLDQTDMEVREKGREYILIGNYEDLNEDSEVIEITGYQDISLYETIDFDKPVNSMNIGMMPSKLALMLINIGVSQLDRDTKDVTIYDPFVGLGTTAFLANGLGYDCIASDKEITAMKRNADRWLEQKYAHADKRITTFKHDIFEPWKKPFLKSAQVIASEGWLGPIITDRTSEKEIFKAQDEIVKLYKAFLENIDTFYDKIVAVFTIPIHLGTSSYVKESLEERCKDHKINYEFLPEVYKRPKQKVGRQIVIITK